MRPTVSEQLAGIRRILDEVIAPQVTEAYPVDMLRGVLANLEMLERSWTRVVPFLAWDNEQTAELLRDVASVVDHGLAARIAEALAAAAVDPLDVAALDARNTTLRELLAEAVPQLATGGERAAPQYARVRAHLRARIDRFPFNASAPMPGATR
ncbi:MAG TPA: hypothetical protein VF183_10225 [Acidimicrobiales bacterium]